ncbi:MAG: Ca2+-binding EF-hand superfamily protein [Paraglaciecola sp.]
MYLFQQEKDCNSTNTMLSDFQRNKLAYFFSLYDLNNNDFLQLDDFTDIADRLCEKLQYQSASKHHEFLVRKTVALFHRLLTDIPHKDEQRIYLDQWLKFFEEKVLKSGKEDFLDDYVELIIGYIFDLFDENNDGYISLDEYKQVFDIYGIDVTYVDKAFDNLDLNRDMRLSRYELIRSVETFLLSDDPLDKGNWIFGNWNGLKS